MKILEDRIRQDGVLKPGNVLKVDNFLNHQMDIALFDEMGKEWARRFADKPINKILTIEASGIGAGLRTKVNATVGTSTDIVDFDEEVKKNISWFGCAYIGDDYCSCYRRSDLLRFYSSTVNEYRSNG